ncbi:carboxy terminal-processing peptidase [Pseudoflavitalea rhizosphaerae]|uniref:carboxy terminal-processing peptidase n=1 Tax=Pseudoflavitalea rhizosphaerae TaxID=1884793 RepID=UPI000F8F551F|nr:carboxy terminal-processing peptidase [Pseudoflavitalea rhizosphaerae]
MRGINKPSLFLCGFLLTAAVAICQPVDITKEPEHKRIIQDAVVSNLISKHYAPKPLNNQYSLSVWKNFIHYLDPNHILFLQADLNKLAAHQQSIDEQLKTGSTAFFDAVMDIYRKRITEVQLLYPKILSANLQRDKKEMFDPNRKHKAFPSGPEERKESWRKMLKYDFLKKYFAAKQAIEKKGTVINQTLPASLEASIKASIRQQYDGSFSQQLTGKSITEKFYQYLNIVTMEMDPHSTFIMPDINRAPPGIDGKPYYSVGFTASEENAEHYIRELIPGSLAEKSGQELVNQRIIAIRDSLGNMVPVSGKSSLELAFLLSGKKGSTLNMIISNDAMEEKEMNIPREEMRYNSYKMRSAILERNGKKTGYVHFSFFYGNFAFKNDFGVEADLLRELDKLNGQEAEALIIDLRGNPGGSTGEAERMLGDLMGGGDVSILKGKYSEQRLSNPANTVPRFKGPLTIMLDESSASASEILSAAVQDHRRGILIGTESSFGKGTAQTTIGIGKYENNKQVINYGSLHLTEKKFYRISGISTQFKGVTPDIVIQQRMSNNSIREIDYPTALPADTLKVENYTPGKWNFNYDLVVKQAKDRISNNPSLQSIGSQMQQLEKLQNEPWELSLQGFAAKTKAIAQLEANIKKARELDANHLLQVESSLPPWINPDTLLPFEHLQYQHWLNKLKKDIYLAEALNVTEDMMNQTK